jgi:hypothetical protein
MSILELGKKAKIITKSKERGEIIKIEISSDKIFSEAMEDKPISEIGKEIIIGGSVDLSERESTSPLTGGQIERIVGTFPGHFTEIILEDIAEGKFDDIISGEFEIELKKILPLKVQENEPFFKCIKDPEAIAWIKGKLSDKDYCPTIDVYVGVSGGARELGQIWKYYPEFTGDLDIGKSDIAYGEGTHGQDKKFAYYYLYSVEDLEIEKRLKENRETGLWIRNKNFLVKEADYLDKPGSRKDRIVHEPLRNWLFGEIFHQGMTEFLVVTRNEYNWDSSDFLSFVKKMYDILYPLNKELREAWKYGQEVRESIIKPFSDVGKDDNPFSRCDNTLSKMGILDGPEKAGEILQKLGERRRSELEEDEKRIDILIGKKSESITLADNEKLKVIVDPRIGPDKDSLIGREAGSKRIIIRISPSLFSPKQVTFLGKSFSVYYVNGERELPGVSVNTSDNKIFVNPFNQEISTYSVSFVEICIATEMAYVFSRTKDEMKDFLLKLLGAKLTREYNVPEKYLFSLKDELQRRQWSK